MRSLASILFAFFTTASFAVTIEVIPSLPGAEYSIVHGISADGTTVVGESGGRAFVFRDGVTTEIEPLTDDTMNSLQAVSADGRTAVGNSQGHSSPGVAIISRDGFTEALGVLSASDPYSFAYDISGDASTAVGVSLVRRSSVGFGQTYSAPTVFKNGTVTSIGSLGCDSDALLGRGGVANAVSADGQVIVGQSCGRAFRYESGVMEDIGTLNNFESPIRCGAQFLVRSTASDVSADGRRIVGWSVYTTEVYHAFLYVEGVMRPLSGISGVGGSYAQAISGDGRVVVGTLSTRDRNDAAIWIDEGTGRFRAYLLSDYLKDRGVNLERLGWEEFWSLDDVSADGQRLVGSGVKDGQYQMFLIDLSKKKTHKKKKKRCRGWGYCWLVSER